jgi:malonate-semialdehyde dehydrogenase (acetylating)/methylmalonate-semialdehyde dehydrogenase
MRQIDHFLSGGVSVATTRTSDVFDPNNGGVQAKVALGGQDVLDIAVAAAQKAQPGWAATNPQRRARVMFNFKALVEKHMDELAHLLSSEHGKVIADSKGDIQRGLEVVEFMCGAPHLLKGELPRHDSAVDVRPGHHGRQCVHHEALRARPVGAGAAG